MANKPIAKTTKKIKPAAPKTAKFIELVNKKTASYREKALKNNTQNLTCLIAEFFGTFLLTLAIIILMLSQNPQNLVLLVAGIVLLVGSVSSALLNPALTLGYWIIKKIKLARAIAYIIAQALGGFVAWGIVTIYTKANASAEQISIFKTNPLTAGQEWYIFFAEIIGALIVAFGLASAIRLRRKSQTAISSALAYGLAYFTAHFITMLLVSMAGIQTTSFFNPVLAFVFKAVNLNIWSIAIYIIAPIIGAVLGFILHNIIHYAKIELTVTNKN